MTLPRVALPNPLSPVVRPRAAALACVVLLAASAMPARAQFLQTNIWANDATYTYNSHQGLVSSSGNSHGSVAPGEPVATAWDQYAGGQGPLYVSSSAAAMADFATGGLHAALSTEGYYSDAAAYTFLQDGGTFHVAGADASTVTRIGVNLQLTGAVSELRNVNYLYNFGITGSGFGAGVGWQATFDGDGAGYFGYAGHGGAGEPSGFESWQVLAATPTDIHFHGVVAFTGASRDFLLGSSFNLRCSGGTDCNFGNSAHLSFDLPEGVSFTSHSGLLLSAVPEPGGGALMLGGLAVVALLARRRLGGG